MTPTALKHHEIVLAAMVPAGTTPFSPVQVQKLLFLVDDRVSSHISAERFQFAPYHYGPFDVNVYRSLDFLSNNGLVNIVSPRASAARRYQLTDRGVTAGHEYLKSLPPPVQHYIAELVTFVQSLSFSALVTAIYDAYPHMRENSVFSSVAK